MAREVGRNPLRVSIAHAAARLMAEDGIEDYGQAKRKAARQVGATDARQMPTNDEIDVALTLYRGFVPARPYGCSCANCANWRSR